MTDFLDILAMIYGERRSYVWEVKREEEVEQRKQKELSGLGQGICGLKPRILSLVLPSNTLSHIVSFGNEKVLE